MPNLRERLEGGLIGMLIGDALGVPYEAHTASDIPALDEIEYKPPVGYQRAHRDAPPGTWSADGAQALCLLASLLDRNQFDPEDFSRLLLRWHDRGYMAVDGKVFDIGVVTARAIKNLRAGVSALYAGPDAEEDNGNGSIMRVLPLVLWHEGTEEELVYLAEQQSRVTHGHLRSRVCCALYCLWARHTLEGEEDSWEAAVSRLREIYARRVDATVELEEHIRPDKQTRGHGTMYVVDCLHSARWAAQYDDFESVVRAAVAIGGDTDTTACIAGGIAGLRFGIQGIPMRWRDGLRGRDLFEPLLERLIACRAGVKHEKGALLKGIVL